jgi:hypothetical protein
MICKTNAQIDAINLSVASGLTCALCNGAHCDAVDKVCGSRENACLKIFLSE